MYGLFANYSDGCTYDASHLVAVFDNKEVAELACDELNTLCVREWRNRASRQSFHRDFPAPENGFSVKPVTRFQAESESRVKGIVDEILKTQFPREGVRP